MRHLLQILAATAFMIFAAVPATDAMAAPVGQNGCPASSVAFTEAVAYQMELANGLDPVEWTPQAFQTFWDTVDQVGHSGVGDGDGILCAHPEAQANATGHGAGERNWTNNNSASPNGS